MFDEFRYFSRDEEFVFGHFPAVENSVNSDSLELLLLLLQGKRRLNKIKQKRTIKVIILQLLFYTDTEQVCKKILFVPIGITCSNQILLCKLDKNKYKNSILNLYSVLFLRSRKTYFIILTLPTIPDVSRTFIP